MKEPRYRIDGEFTLDGLVALLWLIEDNPTVRGGLFPKNVARAITRSIEKAERHRRDWWRSNRGRLKKPDAEKTA